MENYLKADLHSHPSFFSHGYISKWALKILGREHLTEKRTPTIEDILLQARKKGVELLAITSCSSPAHQDKRWESYVREASKYSKKFQVDTNKQRITARPNSPNPIQLIHGQELKTNQGDLNVLFAEKFVPILNSNGDIYYLIDAAKDSGESVLVGINQVSKCKIPARQLGKLHKQGKIDFLETYIPLDTRRNNGFAMRISEETGIPGIAVSDSHRIEDIASASTIFPGINPEELKNYTELSKAIKTQLKGKEFKDYIHCIGNDFKKTSSRVLYGIRLLEAIARGKLGLKDTEI